AGVPTTGRSDAEAAATAPEAAPAAPAESGESIWSPRLRRRTAALWIVWFGINFSYYGAFIWLPSLLVSQGFDLVKSFGYTLIITLAQLPGYAVAAWLIEVWGRRVTLAVFLVGSAVSAGLFGLADYPATIIAAGMALSFFNLGAWGALYAIGPELYPTATRGSGTGAAAAFGRIASIIAPLLVPFLLDLGDTVMVFGVFAAAFVVAALAAFTLPERRGVALEDT
ncbi:MFS transporter, partial [Dietzia sp. HMSC21D01]